MSPAVAAVLRLAEERAGLVFSAGQADLAAAAVRRAMQRAGVGEPAAFFGLAEAGGDAWELLLEELSVGETYFFREPDQLAFLRDTVLPGLAARDGGLRAWSAACATGEEAYTLAMLLGDAGCSGFRVLGTDVVRGRLAAAERATYRRWSLRGVPDQTVGRWFRREGDRFRVRDAVRASVGFAPLNLAEPRRAYVAAGAWGMDLVLCRNVLIYLDDATTRHVAARLLESLAPDGWLFLGASDPPLAELVPCEVVPTGAGVAYRRPRRAALPPPADPPLRPAAGAPAGTVPPRSSVMSPAPVPAGSARAADVESDAGEAAARVRALADRGALDEAAAACAAALRGHAESAELLVLHSTLLFAGRRYAEAAAAARRALYLDRGCAVAHLALGSALARVGDAGTARRAFRNAAELLRAGPGDAAVPASGGESAARLLAVAEAQLHVLGEVA
ncbi:MAG TPA: protein-glutamate O-methyltransferase CheR [Longimicrobiaceae bacterium]